jgi:hypothetical protein
LALTDSPAFTESVLSSLAYSNTIAETLEFTTTLAIQQMLGLTLEDSLEMGLSILLGDELWEAWVLNGNAFAPSVYSGFDFNSYATYNNSAYGCKDDGVYELTGTTDAGTAIKAGIVLPETYWGSMNKKRFRKAFFGLTGSGTPSIRLETDSGSETYMITDSRANISRSLYGRTWTLKLQSFDTLEFIELVPIVLTR